MVRALTVNVGAAAVGGVWRPGSCEDVKHGVVLTNISENVRAVIEGCTITVDAGGDITRSAVSIAGLGANSSVELIGCNVTATFDTASGPMSRQRRHGTVRVESNAVLGGDSRIQILDTTITMEEHGGGEYGSAVLFDVGTTSGDRFAFHMSRSSTLTATCESICAGLLVLGDFSLQPPGATFGADSEFKIHQSSVAASAKTGFAFGLVFIVVTFSDHGLISIFESSITATVSGAGASALGLDLRHSSFAQHCTVRVATSNVNASSPSHAYVLAVGNSVSFANNGTISIEDSQLTSDFAATESAALLLRAQPLENVRIFISDSALAFFPPSGTELRPLRSGALTCGNTSWNAVSLTVKDTSFIAAKTPIGSGTFVQWPRAIDGMSPQSFTNVTFSFAEGPSNLEAAPFDIVAGDTNFAETATLCLRDVRWSNGTAITSGPAEFTVPAAAFCTPPVIVDVGAAAVDGVWRPGSCDDVKSGVVLTNISDNIRAVIEGCGITVDAGSNTSLSAVSITGLGANSSVELIGCNVTATFRGTVDGWENRHGVVRIEPNATLGNANRILILGTTVNLVGAGHGMAQGASVLFDSGLASGDDFAFIVSKSLLRASCLTVCLGIFVLGHGTANGQQFGNRATFAINESSVTVSGSDANAVGLRFASKSTFGNGSSLSVVASSISVRDTTSGQGVHLGHMTLGHDSAVDVFNSTVTVTSRETAIAVNTGSASFVGNGALNIRDSRLISSAQLFSAALRQPVEAFTIPNFVISNSILEFVPSSSSSYSAAIASSQVASWRAVSLSVADSVFRAANVSGKKGTFVAWPATIEGSLPQSFNNVTLSTEPEERADVRAFGFAGTTEDVNATLCLRDVRWSNGTAITSGPAEFTVPAAAFCTPPVVIDVGATAVHGEWRPGSCGDVQGGVVLTNISDNVRAVIEGCGITVDAGSDTSLSAVSIAGLGENSSVELIGCNVTAAFNHTATSTTDRHGAVRVEANATLGNASRILIVGTTVNLEGAGHSAAVGSAVFFDNGIVSGDGFAFIVSNQSVLKSSCQTDCNGIFVFGSSGKLRQQFGNNTTFAINNSSVAVSSIELYAGGLRFFGTSTFGDGSAVAVVASSIVCDGTSSRAHSLEFNDITFGHHSTVSVLDSRIIATSQRAAVAVHVGSSSFAGSSAVSIHNSQLTSSAPETNAALQLRTFALAIPTLKISESVFEFVPSSTTYSAAIAASGLATWKAVSLTVTDSVFSAVNTSTAGPRNSFVLWPRTISGGFPQSFDNVTFSTAPHSSDVNAFSFFRTEPSVNATLCLRDVRWSNGTAITSGPPAFTVPTPAHCWPPVIVDVGASAVNGVWRPGSCDAVQGGVVLTNIGDNVRAVIEGCDITVDAGTDPSLSAVSIAGLGANSSVELIGCNVKVTFDTTSSVPISRQRRHGTVRVESNAVLGGDSRILIVGTTVNLEGAGHSAAVGSAVFFDNGIVSGDGFAFLVSNQSLLKSSCQTACTGILVFGAPTRQRFGQNTTFAINNSSVAVSSIESFAGGLRFFGGSTFGDGSAVSVAASSIVVVCDAAASADGVELHIITFGHRSTVSVLDSRIVATSQRAALAVRVGSCSFAGSSAVSIHNSRLTSSAPETSAALQLLAYALAIPSLTISESVLEFVPSSNSYSAAIASWGLASWKAVSLAVVDSVFNAANTSTAWPISSFVLWPRAISGGFPQSFTNVTFSPAPHFSDVKAFGFFGTESSVNATLCLRDVRWSNGTAITSGPAEFTVPAAAFCTPPVIVDVGASASNGVWRPSSCDDVQGGVVLTNIGDNIRAVIEGCIITVDAGNDLTTAAVSIAGLGENSSVELIGCNVTATFNTTPPTDWNSMDRHGAVRVQANATLGNASRLLIHDSVVTMEERGSGAYGSAVLFDDGVESGDGFVFIVSNGSVLKSSCQSICVGVAFQSVSAPLRFGGRTRFLITDSTVTVSAKRLAHGLWFTRVVLGDNSAVTVSASTISVTVIGDDAVAYGILLARPAFGEENSFSVLDSRITSASSRTAFAIGTGFAVSFAKHGTMLIHNSRLTSRAPLHSATLLLRPRDFANTSVSIAASAFEFSPSDANAGAIMCRGSLVVWTTVSLTVKDSSFRAADTIPNGHGTFVQWPRTIAGISPQSFDNVTFSPALHDNELLPFGFSGAVVNVTATLCLRDVRWSDGISITSGPPAFTVPAPAHCWPPVIVDVGANAVGGEWRPGSCDDVQGGVVLTNISDNVRAVIEGCGITVDAGSDTSLSAVSIAGLGENSSVELIGCNVTATFYDTSNVRHSAVRVRSPTPLGSGSRFVISGTRVSMVEYGIGKFGSAVLFSGPLHSDRFTFLVSSGSVLRAACINHCNGLLMDGIGLGIDFGNSTRISIIDSSVIATAGGEVAGGIVLLSRVSFGNACTVLIARTVISTTALTRIAYGVRIALKVFFGQDNVVSIVESTITTITFGYSALGVSFTTSVAFERGSVVAINGSTITASGQSRVNGVRVDDVQFGADNSVFVTRSTVAVSAVEASASAVEFEFRVVFGDNGRIVIDDSNLTSSAAALSLPWGRFLNAAVTVNSSLLNFNQSSSQAGGITSANALGQHSTWINVSLAVSTTRFVSIAKDKSRMISAQQESAFVQWPKTISGASPQVFDNVTFETTPSSFGDQEAFEVAGGEPVFGAGATLCLRDVRWSWGKAIVAGPRAFMTPRWLGCSAPTPSMSQTATISPRSTPSESISRSQPPTPSLVQTETIVPPRPAAVPAEQLPPAVEVVATTATAAGGAVAAFVGAGVTGATQAGRTLAILQLVACSSGENQNDATQNGAKSAAASNASNQSNNDEDGTAAPFPQALLPWVKVGGGQAGFDRGVVLGNVLAVGLAFLAGLGLWAAAAVVVRRASAARPQSLAARLGADEEAPAVANTASIRMSRLLRFPGIAVTVPLAFAVDGYIGESIALIRHGIEGHQNATALDVVFGFTAIAAGCCLWATSIYIAFVVVPRNVVFRPTSSTRSEQRRDTGGGNGARPSERKTGASGFAAGLYRYLCFLRDGDHAWSVVCSDESARRSDTKHSAPAETNVLDQPDPIMDLDADAKKERSQEEEEHEAVCEAETSAVKRHLFAARWAVLFAPLRAGALFYPALDIAASVAVAIARGLRPRTSDGCQRALLAVAAVQVALLVAVVALRPFVAPLKTAVAAVAAVFLALSAVVGAAAGLASSDNGSTGTSTPSSGNRESLAITAGYLATCASIALLANPVMALWRVVEGRVATRSSKVDARVANPQSSNSAEEPLLSEGNVNNGSPRNDDANSTFSFEMDSFRGGARSAGHARGENAPGWVWGGDHGEVCDAMADLLDVEAKSDPDLLGSFEGLHPEAEVADPLVFDVDMDEAATGPQLGEPHANADGVRVSNDVRVEDPPIVNDDDDGAYLENQEMSVAKRNEDLDDGGASDHEQGVHRRVYRDGEVVVEKGGEGAVIAAELEAMLDFAT